MSVISGYNNAACGIAVEVAALEVPVVLEEGSAVIGRSLGDKSVEVVHLLLGMPAEHVSEEFGTCFRCPSHHLVGRIEFDLTGARHYGVMFHLVTKGNGLEIVLEDFCDLVILEILVVGERGAELDALLRGEFSERSLSEIHRRCRGIRIHNVSRLVEVLDNVPFLLAGPDGEEGG